LAGPTFGSITDLESANRALERIVEQAEGATGNWATAHYGRFLDMLDDYLAMGKEGPGFEPAHPVLAAGMRGVERDRTARLHHRPHHRRQLRPLKRRL
jgi:hypothetical protein